MPSSYWTNERSPIRVVFEGGPLSITKSDLRADTELEVLSVEDAFSKVKSGPGGLSKAEASRRMGLQRPTNDRSHSEWGILVSQFRSPILLLLAFAAILSGFLGETVDAVTIMSILVASTLLSYYQERQANTAVRRLMLLVETKFRVLRDASEVEVALNEVVAGDVAVLKAGSSIPGDGLAIHTDGLIVDESALTGESASVEKSPQLGMQGVLYAGTHVQSGSGTMLVLKTGNGTLFGSIAEELRHVRPEPQFHQGIRRYGYLLMEFTLLLTLAVFLVNVALHKPVIESFLFSLALAVGLTPQLLPAIMSITLAKGARQLADQKVVVKRLEAIEDLGSMDLLCSDKTGTLTTGTVKVAKSPGKGEFVNDKALEFAQINAKGSKGYENPIDQSLLDIAPEHLLDSTEIVGEIPYDFHRRRQSVVATRHSQYLLITKGAVADVLKICCLGAGEAERVQSEFASLSAEGYRVLAVATRTFDAPPIPSLDLEADMELIGLVAFEDPLREDSATTVAELRKAGVQLKLITGDNELVAAHIAKQVGMDCTDLMTGAAVQKLPERALTRRVRGVEVFAEVDPIQKERIISACKRAGYVVGYIGDGINDGPALHAADVGISVSSAVDIARESADFVMLERGLDVILGGVSEGRRIFTNTMKYVMVTSSANLGNMFSMAATSLFLPFLPLLPSQVLLNNFLTDIPAMGIAGDNVDPEMVQRPQRWKVRSLRNYMIAFGLHSSIFDFLTFGSLIWIFRAGATTFRTAWFIESALSELLILLVVRTRKPFFQSRPGKAMILACLGVAILILGTPYVPISRSLAFEPLSAPCLLLVLGILCLYVSTAELLKRVVYRRDSSPV